MKTTSLEWTKAFEEYAAKLKEDTQAPGIAVGICREGELIYHKGLGFRDREEQLEITLDTVFGIGSVTKSFTCVAIMKLQEAGKLRVHDPVIQYLPEFRMPLNQYTDQVTIHHLMTHTTGLPPLPTLYSAGKRSMEQDPELKGTEHEKRLAELPYIDTHDELIEFIAAQEVTVLGPPGTQFSYSNDSYALLGVIIERLSGISYEQYVTETILQPAGMSRTVFTAEELEQFDDVAKLYTRNPGNINEVYASPSWWASPSMTAAGFLKSTIRDLLRYTEIFRTGGLVEDVRILSEESVQQMTTPHFPIQGQSYYGYGLMITPGCFGGTLVEHGGSIKGVSAQIFTVPETGISGAVLSNADGVSAQELMTGSLNVMRSRPADELPFSYPEVEVSAESLADYLGVYQSGEGAHAAVGVVDGQLSVTFQGSTFPFRCVDRDRFVFKKRDTQYHTTFIRDEEGRVIRMSLGFRQLQRAEQKEHSA
ncbi:serine hydrolase [Brevibacillus ruminantium]|uniref:Serine hydrolase n=1 Tax=Brevibacillus ruminantium TaxID=2950604 RepID=A0ABY4WA63_9BACL|nr:serine hydrolase [Brevibacillus ruminantium]USG64055.1 serine hydrolase [Brevibacillus ruminantium]